MNVFLRICRKIVRRVILVLKKYFFWLKFIFLFGDYNAILVNTPTHINIGDHAISIAECEFLKEICGIEKFYEIPSIYINGMEKKYAKVTPKNKKVLVHGGGYLGEIWKEDELRVRRVLKSFDENEIIIFPQTITFFDFTSDFYNESKKDYTAHKHLKVFLRDERSYRFLKDEWQLNAYYVPDIVLSLDKSRETLNRENILMCFRNDKERSLNDDADQKITGFLKDKFPEFEIIKTDMMACGEKGYVFASRRTEIVDSKLREFKSSKLVLTDRLHGMIFAYITGTPCVAFNNINGKVGGVYQWIKPCDYLYFINSVDELPDVLAKMDLGKIHFCDSDKMIENLEPLKKVLLS